MLCVNSVPLITNILGDLYTGHSLDDLMHVFFSWRNIIATACEDSFIRVFYVGSGTDQPLKVLAGMYLT